MNIACVVGARPNFIKIAPILKAFERFGSRINAALVHTGQHYDPMLSDVFFDDLLIPKPTHYLGVEPGSQAEQTAAILVSFDRLCATNAFDRVLVVGDVTSTLACTLAAVKRGIPVDHVEAGLRSRDRSMPEELNRLATDALASRFFATEPEAVSNLLNEGHQTATIHHVGNVMIDTQQANLDQALARKAHERFGLVSNSFAVATLHRPSNVDGIDSLARILDSLGKAARIIPILFPVHPRTRKFLSGLSCPPGVVFCDPLGYLDFLSLLAHARAVITDSGGIQEESTALGLPCLTMRSNTERPITVEIGSNTLIGNSPTLLLEKLEEIMTGRYKKGRIPELWDGHAADRIAGILMEG